jgi:signal transduction histidine kinase
MAEPRDRRLNGKVGVVNVLRSGRALLLASESYLRAVFVLVGAALALALGIADFTLLSLVAQAGAPVWAVALLGVVLVGGPLLAGLLPAARQVEGVAVQSLLLVGFPAGLPGPATGWPQRRRTLSWFLLHVAAGAIVVAAVLGLIALAGSWWTVPAAAATLLGTLLAGRFLAWLGPVLLGPSYAERLQRLEADAARATERNRIAREIHDSVGHALSVVTVQASAARKLIERDPGFAEQALATIETASRRAAAELDQMLGLLRDETRPSTAPSPGLGALSALITGARSAGLNVNSAVSGDLSRLPSLVSQEAYRIVQEGLTNALKYSADGTAALDVRLRGDALGIRLTNPAGGKRPARAGRGLSGIDERAAALGGTANVGEDGGRWVLCVTLPAGDVLAWPRSGCCSPTTNRSSAADCGRSWSPNRTSPWPARPMTVRP